MKMDSVDRMEQVVRSQFKLKLILKIVGLVIVILIMIMFVFCGASWTLTSG
jgi:hypothetical protein